MESLKNGKCVLEKSLNFLFKNVYEPWLFFSVIKMMLPCFLLIIVHYYSHTERKLCMYMYSLNKGLQLWDSGLKQKPHQVIQNLEFQPGQVIFRTPLTCPPLRVQAIHPLTKSLTKTNKMWPWVSKMRELLAHRMSWNSSFFLSWLGLR